MAHVFVTREVPGNAPAVLEAAGHTVTVFPEARPPSREELLRELSGAEGALTMVTDRFDAELLAALPKLRVISNMAVGYDNIDPAMAAAAGVWVTNTPGVLAETTADFAFALLLAAARNVAASARDTLAGGWTTWSPTAFLGTDVHGATLGIVGFGEIGQAMARRAIGFGMNVLINTRTRNRDTEVRHGVEYRTLPDLLAQSDFVSLHVPLTPQTRRLMGAREFAAMKPTALFINTARGGVVDQEALVAALHGGRIGGAALDVTDPEPLPLSHPLYAFPNVLITPHIASASLTTRSRMARMAAENIIAALDGRQPPNALNEPTVPRM